ncbi:hypothetical protein Pmar_PMAR021008 [Perkinsus marinus ATCC 50983]|uniref:Uncharacterized protein n=1 Tax=Perkinsus marinus (strain ATCC 50983 / TXsc) TaxID=423536 RepID=C5KG56_PERM5|nr:hypothetical protein Pmar_PMAR021008 [Perkinsus marinus ATCC 50983]EER16412.1 hypothetical protein Pmar_PMAR021008 [Perkinsus marinus ATCC 50983]|eukprot:XP_002784616.1 hypothetical protein Pmar_PMAR021008 [Perkinsus marinus ATCC 50983]
MSNAIITSSVAASKIDALSKYVDLYSDLPSLQEVIDYHHVKSQAEHVQVDSADHALLMPLRGACLSGGSATPVEIPCRCGSP